jgi:DNA-binding MltR family transcriptional regulator
MSKAKLTEPLKFGEAVYTAPGVLQLVNTPVQNKFLAELHKESDRSAVLIAVSYFDEILKAHLLKHFCKGNNKAREELFDFNGPFASFSAKIEVLFCFGHLNRVFRDDLHIMRKLRNHCAHCWDEFKFDEFADKKFVSSLKNYLPSPKDESFPGITAFDCRSRFMFACAFYVLILNSYIEKQ